MAINRPEPGARFHDGPSTVPRLAATVMLLRGGGESLEVLLVQRSPQARFMAGAWVFPGGSVDRADGEGQLGLQTAARRELLEETGIELPADGATLPFARWITPEPLKIRFDTWFYLASAPEGIEAKVDGSEIVGSAWLSPAQALERQAAGQLLLVFPTIKQLQQLAAFESAQALLVYAQGRAVDPVQPRVVGSGEAARILLPGDPGYSGAG